MGALLGSNWWGLSTAGGFGTTGGYDATGNVQPYGQAPNSPHIMWTLSTTTGGQPGGSTPSDMEGQFTSTSILNTHWEPIIIYGLNIYTTWNSAGEAGSGFEKPERWVAVDIRTGEIVWQRTRGITGSETIVGCWIQKFHTLQEYGSWACFFATGSGSMGYLYDPFTGQHYSNVTNISWGSAIIGDHPEDYRHAGGLYRFYNSGSGNSTMLNCWNSTKIWAGSPGTGQANWTTGIQWTINITETFGLFPPTGVRVLSNERILLQTLPNIETGSAYTYFKSGYFTIAAVNARTGEKLWGPINYTDAFPRTHDVSFYGAREDWITLFDKDTMEAYCYSAKDGSKLWGPVSIKQYTNAFDYLEMDTEVYKGVVVFWGFGGNVVGLNATTGEIMWHFTRGPADLSSPYGYYVLWDFASESFADGKIFLAEGSMYDVPLNPSRRLAIDVYTGELVWSILNYAGRTTGAIADGYLLEWDSQSNQLISFGKGPTATTVAAGPKVSVDGDSVVVEGMVTDISPGTKAYNREARFPHGVPAVSEESQRTWMEYVYLQQAKPANATGVEVVISVMDPNNNPYEVGTTTSNADGFYTLNFVPDVPGEYIVTAKYAGSESYWSSFAQTSLFVEQAPAASPTPTPPAATMTDTYVTGFGIGIIIAIVVVGLLLFLMFRKR
jgi:outer membrane protein assembly factor BamB